MLLPFQSQHQASIQILDICFIAGPTGGIGELDTSRSWGVPMNGFATMSVLGAKTVHSVSNVVTLAVVLTSFVLK